VGREVVGSDVTNPWWARTNQCGRGGAGMTMDENEVNQATKNESVAKCGVAKTRQHQIEGDY
jgi:hypothetical protein